MVEIRTNRPQMLSTYYLTILINVHLTIILLFEEQDSRRVEGNGSVHRHHGGGIWPEEALHLMLVS